MLENLLYVIDTHVLIWYFIGSKRLPEILKDEIDHVRSLGGRFLVPTIVLAEALDVSSRGKVDLDFRNLYHLIQSEPEFEIVGFGPEIMDEVIEVQNVNEIHDRIIVATARFYGASILTKDQIIKDSGEVETF